ncbi:MAG: hypothetical protein AAGN46_08140 [Acidobacteriota bacterium]
MPRFQSAPRVAVVLILLSAFAAAPLLAQARGGGGAATLLLSEIVVTPTDGEFIEIVNPTSRYLDLSDVYLTDATFASGSTFYYNLPTGANAGGGGFGDFYARFPDGAVIAPGERQTVAMAGSDAFSSEYGDDPTYELFEDGLTADDVPDMREAFAGSINDQGGLTNSGEVAILLQWDGESDLVQDLDYAVWGDKAEAVDKTGESIDGPDGDMTATAFLNDTAIATQDVVSAGAHLLGNGFQRSDLTEGSETLSGGNGATGHDETSEDLSNTWSEVLADPTTGPAAIARLLLSEVVVTPTEGEFVEIFNPNDFAVDLSDVYLTDATFASGSTFYYNLPTGANAGGGGFGDFYARFPDGATIDAGDYQVVALAGSGDFFAEYGVVPDYELFDDGTADAAVAMREATAGSINNQGGLSNSGEIIVLLHWDGANDLVGDLDIALWGDGAEAVAKTGVSIDGPDVDGLPTTYLDDTATGSQDVISATAHGVGDSYTRTDVTEGAETTTGGNGVDGNDETSEDLSNTWSASDAASPGTGLLGMLTLTIDDVTMAEGDAGTTAFIFQVSLSGPAPPGGVTFDITTADDTATVADSDYVTNSQTGETIVAGMMTYDFEVTVNGDTVGESDETFFVNVSNVAPGSIVIADGQGLGTIDNDDALAALEIFEIQGSGDASPFADMEVTTEDNVVFAVGPEGFFMQTPDARDDGDAATSNGIYVFTGTAPTVAVGDLVDVTGDVVELFDELTEFTNSPIVTIGSSGNPLPAPIVFDASTPSGDPSMPSCPSDNFECFEGMYVRLDDGTVTAGNLTFGSDPIAEVTVVANSTRPFRETGVEFPGLGGGIPIFDGNPEILELDPDKLGLPNQVISGGSRFSTEGGLGFEFGDFEIWPSSLVVTPEPALDPVREASSVELTIGTLNMFRFFDDVADGSEQVVSSAEYQCRRDKFVAYIDQAMRNPHVIAVQEVEKEDVLVDLAADIMAAGGPTYTAELVEGNDVGGIDVGYLVDSSVTIDQVTQLGAAELNSCDGSLLHDRPPLLLEATDANGTAFAVLVVHARSLGGIDDAGDTCNSNPSVQRVRQKRLEQAQSIGQMVEDFQTTNPTVPLVVIGDFNAFEFTDGYVDLIGQITGAVDPVLNELSELPIPDPGLINATLAVPQEERYSFIFNGSAQVLDHALLTQPALEVFQSFEFAGGNADAARILLDSCDALLAPDELPLRASDHDGGVLYLLSDQTGIIFANGFESGDTTAWDNSQN